MRLFLFQPKTCWHLVSLKKKKKNSIPPLENLRFIPISKCLHLKSVLLTYFRVLNIHRCFWSSILEFTKKNQSPHWSIPEPRGLWFFWWILQYYTKNTYVYCSRNSNFYLILDPKNWKLNFRPILGKWVFQKLWQH